MDAGESPGALRVFVLLFESLWFKRNWRTKTTPEIPEEPKKMGFQQSCSWKPIELVGDSGLEPPTPSLSIFIESLLYVIYESTTYVLSPYPEATWLNSAGCGMIWYCCVWN